MKHQPREKAHCDRVGLKGQRWRGSDEDNERKLAGACAQRCGLFSLFGRGAWSPPPSDPRAWSGRVDAQPRHTTPSRSAVPPPIVVAVTVALAVALAVPLAA
eukprot:CAMPEP_0184379982 /NCGR_PEP_ID=MMETSP0007-20130409/4346_1 /TAXON_ID=97485 /ORGANISM="Prymnesium parvum, Strain Texoma1" /LENGTH=101 /DNA_ID=CAMNT_0026724975 /DNA_START=295 /DNA_END=596 /DNA_ORIENTATION=-